MELSQKIETKLIRTKTERLRLDYCLIYRTEDRLLQPCGNYGMEIILTDRKGCCRERCRNLAESYLDAVALIRLFAECGILPKAMQERMVLDKRANECYTNKNNAKNRILSAE